MDSWAFRSSLENETWVHVNNLTETLGDFPWAERIRLPDGRQIRYKLHETPARVEGFLSTNTIQGT